MFGGSLALEKEVRRDLASAPVVSVDGEEDSVGVIARSLGEFVVADISSPRRFISDEERAGVCGSDESEKGMSSVGCKSAG